MAWIENKKAEVVASRGGQNFDANNGAGMALMLEIEGRREGFDAGALAKIIQDPLE